MTLAFNVNSALPPCLAFVLESCRNSQYYKYMNEQIGNYDEYFDNRLFVKVIFLMGSQTDYTRLTDIFHCFYISKNKQFTIDESKN